MVLNTFTVGAAVTPSVINTAISHYVNRKPLRGKPTAHISYDEGLHLVRQFLEYASHHTVDEVQAFTAQWVPCPRWVKAEEITVPETHVNKAASLIQAQLGPHGIQAVGGTKWWQWRPSASNLRAEWIEMRAHYNARKTLGTKAQRIMLYVHGGAYYFGSVDEHRYQLQRHARKLKARLLAPRYRLAPQFPFPCGLQDALASYLMLLEEYDPSTILLAGDSAGAGMTISLLVTLRDQGIPLPAGAMLLSPWVDLTHSFPSVAGDGKLDYIPPSGFHHRPSMAWPPPNAEDLRKLHEQMQNSDAPETVKKSKVEVAAARVSAAQSDAPKDSKQEDLSGRSPLDERILSLEVDGKHVELLDQIQLYATNALLDHPLVSPVMQPSLGGLPPLLIQTGGGELLLDEQIYLAHKAANPSKYPPADAILDLHDPKREILKKYPPTMVQLQVWEDLCHVAHTLSFTRPAKHMYRAVAQFGNWCYTHASQDPEALRKEPSYLKDVDADALSIVSTSTTSSSETAAEEQTHSRNSSKARSLSAGAPPKDGPGLNGTTHTEPARSDSIGPTRGREASLGTVSATEPLPPFVEHMIRQEVDRHGSIYPLAPVAEIPALQFPASAIGVPKAAPVRKWMARQAAWDKKYASAKRKVQNRRLEEMRKGYVGFGEDERPPPSALAGRRVKGLKTEMDNLDGRSKKKSWGLAMWSGWGSKHDEVTVAEAQSKMPAAAVNAEASAVTSPVDGAEDQDSARGSTTEQKRTERSRSAGSGLQMSSFFQRGGREPARTSQSTVAAEGQGPSDKKDQTSGPIPITTSTTGTSEPAPLSAALPPGEKVEGSENTFLAPTSSRPHNGTVAYPFKLRADLAPGGAAHGRSASMLTLDSAMSDAVEPGAGAATPAPGSRDGPSSTATAAGAPPKNATAGEGKAMESKERNGAADAKGKEGEDGSGDGAPLMKQPSIKDTVVAAVASLAPVGGAEGIEASTLATNEATNTAKNATTEVANPGASKDQAETTTDSRPKLETFNTAAEFQ